MKVVIQRVENANLSIGGKIYSKIGKGFLVLLGIEESDCEKDIDYMVKKIINLRVFNDENNKMNLSTQDVNGEILVVSQFTLYADTKKGNRPSFIKAAKPEIAVPIYEQFIYELKKTSINIETGIFGEEMKINLVNDGPVTIIIDTNDK